MMGPRIGVGKPKTKPQGLKEKTLGWSATDFDPNAAYDNLLEAAIAEWNMTESEIKEFIAQIEWHESRGDHTLKQKGGGPGRGLFQYEMDTLKDGERQRQGGSVARRRFALWMDEQGIDVGTIPEDFSRLGPQLQRAIFLADAMAKGGDPKLEGVHNWWLDKHWAGYDKMVAEHGEEKAKEIRFDRSKAFRASMDSGTEYYNGY